MLGCYCIMLQSVFHGRLLSWSNSVVVRYHICRLLFRLTTYYGRAVLWYYNTNIGYCHNLLLSFYAAIMVGCCHVCSQSFMEGCYYGGI